MCLGGVLLDVSCFILFFFFKQKTAYEMRISDWSSDVCSSDLQGVVSRTLGRRGAVFLVYAVLLAATGLMFKAVPAGFIPTQDKLYLIAGVKLPEGASIARTDAMLSKVADIAMNTEGVA